MKDFDSYFKSGIKEYKAGNYENALNCFIHCINLEPDDPNAYVNKGLMHYMLDQYDESINDYNKALSLNPNLEKAYYNRGLAYKESMQYENALNDFEFLKSQNPNYPDVDNQINLVKKMKTDFVFPSSFIKNFTDDGQNPEVALNRGKLAEEKRQYSEAINSYTNAIKYKYDYIEAYFRRARCYSILGQFDNAIKDYETVEVYIENKDVVKANIGNVYASIEKFDISLKYLNEAVEIDPKNPQNYYYRAQTKAKMGKLESAFIDFTKCLEIEPNDLNALQQRGITRANMKDFEGAVHDFDKLIELVPEDGIPYYNRAITYSQMHEREKCMLDLERASMLGIKEANDLMSKI